MPYLRPATVTVGRQSGWGRAMGGLDAVQIPSVGNLIAQVNRFGPSAPTQYQYVAAEFPQAMTVSPELASTAVLIYQRRAADAYAQFHDAGTEAAIALANSAFGNPVGFVTSHLADVTTTIGAFADSLGLASPGGAGLIGGFDTTTLALIAAGIVGLYLAVR